MAIYSFDGNDLKRMLQGAVDMLGYAKEEIDALNVFPVPDGDTGTNMYQTLVSAVKEASGTASNNIGLVAEAVARGGLMGARGNSGVILSQVLHGFARSLNTKEKASAMDITLALDAGAQTAYRAVMTPVEGTILTVVRKSAEGAAAQRSDDLLRVLIAVLKKAFTALQETPDLLPVLKQAGVVDAGGKGFVVILEGFLQALKSASPAAKASPAGHHKAEVKAASINRFEFNEGIHTVNFVYCTELLVKGHKLPLDIIKSDLSPLGDCLMVVGDENLSKVHIHTNHPGLVLECCLRYGTLHDLKINNMEEQNRELVIGKEQTGLDKPFGIISVGAGEGITGIMKNLGADAVIAGGQTLNPSAGEILKVMNGVPAQKMIILPNNKNIILAAKQAGGLSSKEVTVIPSKSIPQGICALLALNPQDNFETVIRKMKDAYTSVHTIEITTAVRDTAYKELEIKKGEFIGLADGDLKVAGTDVEKVLGELLEAMLEDEGRLITLYYGEAMGLAQTEDLAEKMRKKFGGQDFEVQQGGQPVYNLIISIE